MGILDRADTRVKGAPSPAPASALPIASTASQRSRYPAVVTGEPDKRVAALRRLLETELDRRVGPQFGCWPLLVGVLGVLLGIALLFRGR